MYVSNPLHCGDPQLTTPYKIHFPVFGSSHWNGPPESPWHADLKVEPSLYPPQIMLDVTTWLLKAFRTAHTERSTTGRSTWSRLADESLMTCVFPQPVLKNVYILQYAIQEDRSYYSNVIWTSWMLDERCTKVVYLRRFQFNKIMKLSNFDSNDLQPTAFGDSLFI